MKRERKGINSFVFLILVLLLGCGSSYTPKPSGYVRIDFPPKDYVLFDSAMPYKFEYPVYCYIERVKDHSQPFWINIVYPSLNGKIYIDYKTLNHNLSALSEDVHELAYKHAIKAESIDEIRVQNKEKKVYGIIYDIQGNVATSLQFYLTDSVKNFLRGSLYFNAHPNKDSLSPMVQFCREDIEHLIKTFEWKSSRFH